MNFSNAWKLIIKSLYYSIISLVYYTKGLMSVTTQKNRITVCKSFYLFVSITASLVVYILDQIFQVQYILMWYIIRQLTNLH